MTPNKKNNRIVLNSIVDTFDMKEYQVKKKKKNLAINFIALFITKREVFYWLIYDEVKEITLRFVKFERQIIEF